MPDRLTHRIQNLTTDTSEVIMPDPTTIRRFGDRRTRNQTLLTVCAVILVIAAGAGATALTRRTSYTPPPPGESVPAGSTEATTPSSAPPSSASSAPSSTGTASSTGTSSATAVPITQIPDSAMLQRSDLKLGDHEPLEYGPKAPTTPTALRACGEPYPSDALRTASRSIGGTASLSREMELRGAGRYGTIEELVGAYRDGGAEQFLAELRDQLRRCPGTPNEGWTQVGGGLGGDDSLLVRRTFQQARGGNPPTTMNQYIGVVRIGRVVVVLASVGWETPMGFEQIVRALAPVAVQRAAPLR